jgi:hypothetical protein
MDAECNHEKGLLYNSLIINCLQDTSPRTRSRLDFSRFHRSGSFSFLLFHHPFSRFHSHSSAFSLRSTSVPTRFLAIPLAIFLVIPLPAHLEWNHEKSATLLVGRSTSLFIQGMVKARAVWIANCATRSKANASGEWNNEKRRGIQAVRWPKD